MYRRKKKKRALLLRNGRGEQCRPDRPRCMGDGGRLFGRDKIYLQRRAGSPLQINFVPSKETPPISHAARAIRAALLAAAVTQQKRPFFLFSAIHSTIRCASRISVNSGAGKPGPASFATSTMR